jgi:hypothetical protein
VGLNTGYSWRPLDRSQARRWASLVAAIRDADDDDEVLGEDNLAEVMASTAMWNRAIRRSAHLVVGFASLSVISPGLRGAPFPGHGWIRCRLSGEVAVDDWQLRQSAPW